MVDEDLFEKTKSANEEEQEDDEIEDRGFNKGFQELQIIMMHIRQWAQKITEYMIRTVKFSNSVDGIMAPNESPL